MTDIKENLKAFLMNYPDDLVGAFWAISSILKELGQEWTDFGKKEWGEVFTSSGNDLLLIAGKLAKIRDQHKAELAIEEKAIILPPKEVVST